MTRYVPLAAPLVGLVVALGIVAIEVGRGDGAPDVVASATPAPSATAEAEATPRSVRGREEPFASAGSEWARALLVGTHIQASPAVAVASNGDLIVLTNGMGSQPNGAWNYPDFRPNPAGVPLEFHGGQFDLVLARFKPDGTPEWGRSFGGPHDDFSGSVAAASDGDIFVSGTFEDGFDLGGGAISVAGGRGRDAFVARLDGTGSLQWLQTFATESDESAGSLVELPDGGVVVFVSTSATAIDVGTTTIESATPGRHALAVRLEANGDVAWAIPLGAMAATAAVLDPATREIWVALSESVERRGGYSLRALVRLSPSGDEMQRIPVPGARDGKLVPLSVASIAVDEDGSIVIGGRFEGQVSLGGDPLIADGFAAPWAEGPMDGYVARFAPDGTHLMSRTTGLPRERPSDGVHALALAEDGDILISGTSYLARLDSAGNLLSDVPFPEEPSATDGIPAGVTVPSAGNQASRVGVLIPVVREDGSEDVIISGRFGDRLAFDFGGRILTNRIDDAFIARIEAP